jgi:dienelactone hydrolase
MSAGIVLIGAPAVASRLEGLGYALQTVEIDDSTSDAAAMQRIQAARDALKPRAERVFVVGTGPFAMMAPAAVPGLAGAVSFAGRLIYPTLTAARPVQPMDLLPGVRVPLQLHYGDADPDVPPHHVDQLRDRLGRLGIAHQVLVYPGAGADLLTGPVAKTALTRAERFLERLK